MTDNKQNAEGCMNVNFAKGVYLELSLQTNFQPDLDKGVDYYWDGRDLETRRGVFFHRLISFPNVGDVGGLIKSTRIM
jgi:hypothetical protein